VPLLDFVEIAVRAREVRQAAGYTRGPVSARTLMEKCYPDVLVTGQNLPANLMELVEVGRHGRAIYYNRRHNTAAHRVGIIHGLAHLLYDLPASLSCPLEFQSGATVDVRERRADLFAGEVLMPLVELDAKFKGLLFPRDPVDKQAFDDDVDHAASTFKVPPGFVRFRLFDLAKLRSSNFYVRK